MFTGIIEETGKIQSVTNSKIIISADTVLKETKCGDSIAVNGVCLTVTGLKTGSFEADVSSETMKVTALGQLKPEEYVNLERALKLSDRLGGHIVTGHIDGTGRCIYIKKEGDFYNLAIELTSELSRYVVKKGSITVNGISLTVAEVSNNIVNIAVIPLTYENTNLKTIKVNDLLNIETDVLARYVEKFLSTSDNKSGISMKFLMENGFCEV